MRWVIIGAGAVGGVVGGRLAGAGHEVVLVARGQHLEETRRHGLLVRSPEGDQRYQLPTVGSVADIAWRPGDIAVLAVKSMDTAAVLTDLAAYADPATPVLCMQNGIANERTALRHHAAVFAVCVMLPATHLKPGVVVAHSAPTPGILDLGNYPHGTDATAEVLSAALRTAGFVSEPRADIMRWKHTKLLLNLGNAVEALCGRVDGLDQAVRPLRAEGEAVLHAAGCDASSAEDAARRGDLLKVRPVPGVSRDGGSTWQSLARGARAVEADYLNGEIVLLGRLHGVPTPANETARRLVNRHARDGVRPGVLTPEQFLAATG